MSWVEGVGGPRYACHAAFCHQAKTELSSPHRRVPDESLPAAAILLRRAQDPVVAKLDAVPFDDEELTRPPRLHTQGEDLDDAMANAGEAGRALRRGLREAGESLDSGVISRKIPLPA